ncbi:MAG: carboxypeptidase-like regulatory domain-containing protein [Bacteroidota bacterium]
MALRLILSLLLLLAMLPLGWTATAQTGAVSGRVVEIDTGAPLATVHVFLANTTRGTTTDLDGGYVLGRIEPGRYTLTASMIGYGVVQREVRITAGDTLSLDLRLRAEVYEAGGLEVTAERPRQWERHLRRFTRHFLGSSYNARQARILNPEVLDFEAARRGRELTATASAALVVDNPALGYRLHLILQEFRLAKDQIQYAIIPRVEPLTPTDTTQVAEWTTNREATYEGSMRHFLASLFAGRTDEEGFTLTRGGRRVRNAQALFTAGPRPEEYSLTFEETLDIRHRRTGLSTLTLNEPQATVHRDGWTYDPFQIYVSGAWYDDRVADFLPFDYKPDTAVMVEASASRPTQYAALYQQGQAALERGRPDEALAPLREVWTAFPGYLIRGEAAAGHLLGQAYLAAQRDTVRALEAWRGSLNALHANGLMDVSMLRAYLDVVLAQDPPSERLEAATVYLAALPLLDREAGRLEAAAALRTQLLAQTEIVLPEDVRASVMATDVQREAYALSFVADAGAQVAAWWTQQDELPATLHNERVAAHLQRLTRAERAGYVDRFHPSGLDPRGHVFTRLGWPSTRSSIPSAFTLSAEAQRGLSNGEVQIPRNEFWSYAHIDEAAYYLFVEQNGRFQVGDVNDMIPATLLRGVASRNRSTLPRGQALVEVTEYLHDQLATLQADYLEVFERIQEFRFSGSSREQPLGSFAATVLNTTRQQTLERASRRAEVTPRSYAPPVAPDAVLPMDVRIARFRNPDGTTRAELTWGHLATSLIPPLAVATVRTPQAYGVELTMLVEQAETAQREQHAYVVPYQMATEEVRIETKSIALTAPTVRFTAQWDQYELGAEATPLRTALQPSDTLRALRTTGLEMSDLRPVFLDSTLADIATFYPFRELTPQVPLGLYFEVYGLTYNADDHVRYTVDYEVRELESGFLRRAEATSASTSLRASRQTDEQLIALDLANWTARGPLRVTVRITDETTGVQVERNLTFEMVRPGGT